MLSKAKNFWWVKDLAIIAALAAVSELALRIYAPVYATQLFDNEYTAGLPMDVNNDDFRGAPVAKEKASGEVRILALGDSITFGTGVASNAVWSARLGELTHGHRGGTVSTINGGIEGASLADLIASYEQKWAAYNPDRIVVALTGNMVSLEVMRQKIYLPAQRFSELRQTPSSMQRLKLEANRVMHRFCLPSFLSIEAQNVLYWSGLLTHNIDPKQPYGALLAHGIQQGNLDPSLAVTAWDKFAADLGRLRDVLRAAKKDLIVTYIAPRFAISTERRDNQKNIPVERLTIDPLAKISGIAANLGIHYVDAMAAVRAGRLLIAQKEGRYAPMYIPFDYAHLSEDGHAALAAALADSIGAAASAE